MTLTALINIPATPNCLITYYKGLQMVTLSFMPNLIILIPTDETATVPANRRLITSAQFYPNIFLFFVF